MEREHVLRLHNQDYAGAYDEKFFRNPFGNAAIEFEIALLARLIDGSTTWLDLGCGTGFVLSRFPGTRRAGLDLSPSMLDKAREANPDAIFLTQGDLIDKFPEWNGQWSLVTCMWVPYCYLRCMLEFEQFLRNAVSWTAPGGTLFIPTLDLEDLRPHTVLPYEYDAGPHGGRTLLTSSTWRWIEADGRDVCLHLLAPETAHFLDLLASDFETIEVVRYPPFRPGWVSRKAILARGRHQAGDRCPARVIHHRIPAPTLSEDSTPTQLPEVSTWRLLLELKLRLQRKLQRFWHA